MSYKALEGKKVAVLTETEFITHELDYSVSEVVTRLPIGTT